MVFDSSHEGSVDDVDSSRRAASRSNHTRGNDMLKTGRARLATAAVAVLSAASAVITISAGPASATAKSGTLGTSANAFAATLGSPNDPEIGSADETAEGPCANHYSTYKSGFPYLGGYAKVKWDKNPCEYL